MNLKPKHKVALVAVVLFIFSFLLLLSKAEAIERADICMAIGLDISGSIDNSEMRLQYDGVANTLMNEQFLNVIRQGHHGRMAIMVYTWSDSINTIKVVVPWSTISRDENDPGRVERDADVIAAILFTQEIEHAVKSTSLLVALQAGSGFLQNCPYFAEKQLLNISGDGKTNIGAGPKPMRNMILDAGININGIVVGNDQETFEHYATEVTAAHQNLGFVIEVKDWNEYQDGMLRKFLLEIS